MKKLGYYLKAKRTSNAMLQTEAAQTIGVSRVRYSAMENDRVYSYDPRTLKSVADFLEQTTEFVLTKLPRRTGRK